MNKLQLRFCQSFNDLSKAIYINAIRHGFYIEENNRYFVRGNDGEFVSVDMSNTFIAKRISLIHSELSEALEAIRKNGPDIMDKHCPKYTNMEIELADVVIRCMDMSRYYGFRLSEAIVSKHNFNVGRPYKHDNAF